MKFNKKTFYKIHTWIGLKLSILFFIVCFSGTLATLSHEMDWLFFPESRAQEENSKISYKQRVENIKQIYPEGRINNWTIHKELYLCDRVMLTVNDKKLIVFVNQYTGVVQGARGLTFKEFFRSLHYFLFIPFKIGYFTVLIFGFLLFVSTVTALLFYKKWWKKLFKLNVGKGKIAFYKSLHKLVGSWSIPFCILFSVTGIWYFLERTNIGGIRDTISRKSPEMIPVELDSISFSKLSYNIDYDKAIKVAEQAFPGFEVFYFSNPSNPNRPISLFGKSDALLVRNRANKVHIRPLTYEVLRILNSKNEGTVKWLNDIADPLHFGTWGGLITKIIWFIAGLAISGLILSGIWTLLKRNVNRKREVKAKPSKFWSYCNWVITIAIVFFMYTNLIVKYEVPVKILIVVTLLFGVFFFFGWYIFVRRFKSSKL